MPPMAFATNNGSNHQQQQHPDDGGHPHAPDISPTTILSEKISKGKKSRSRDAFPDFQPVQNSPFSMATPMPMSDQAGIITAPAAQERGGLGSERGNNDEQGRDNKDRDRRREDRDRDRDADRDRDRDRRRDRDSSSRKDGRSSTSRQSDRRRATMNHHSGSGNQIEENAHGPGPSSSGASGSILRSGSASRRTRRSTMDDTDYGNANPNNDGKSTSSKLRISHSSSHHNTKSNTGTGTATSTSNRGDAKSSSRARRSTMNTASASQPQEGRSSTSRRDRHLEEDASGSRPRRDRDRSGRDRDRDRERGDGTEGGRSVASRSRRNRGSTGDLTSKSERERRREHHDHSLVRRSDTDAAGSRDPSRSNCRSAQDAHRHDRRNSDSNRSSSRHNTNNSHRAQKNGSNRDRRDIDTSGRDKDRHGRDRERTRTAENRPEPPPKSGGEFVRTSRRQSFVGADIAEAQQLMMAEEAAIPASSQSRTPSVIVTAADDPVRVAEEDVKRIENRRMQRNAKKDGQRRSRRGSSVDRANVNMLRGSIELKSAAADADHIGMTETVAMEASAKEGDVNRRSSSMDRADFHRLMETAGAEGEDGAPITKQFIPAGTGNARSGTVTFSAKMSQRLKEKQGSNSVGAGGGGSGPSNAFDSRFKAHMQKSKQDQPQKSTNRNFNDDNSLDEKDLSSDVNTAETMEDSVLGESKAISGNHKHLLAIAKLTSQSKDATPLLSNFNSGPALATAGKNHYDAEDEDLSGSDKLEDQVPGTNTLAQEEKRPSLSATAPPPTSPRKTGVSLVLGEHANNNRWSSQRSLISQSPSQVQAADAAEIMNFANLVAKDGKLIGSSKVFTNTKRSTPAFRQSTILSIKPETVLQMANDPDKLRDHGTNCFEQFFVESAQTMYQYPQLDATKDETILGPDVLSAFCFPYGVGVRFFPRAAWEGAKRIGWIGEKGDKYQLQAFTSATGATKHGVALVVQEELQFDSEAQRRKIIEFLKKRVDRRRAVRKIGIWWRRHLLQKRQRRENQARQNSDTHVNSTMTAAATRFSSYLTFATKGNVVASSTGPSDPARGSSSSLATSDKAEPDDHRRGSFFPTANRSHESNLSHQDHRRGALEKGKSFTKDCPPPEVEIGQDGNDSNNSDDDYGDDAGAIFWPTAEEQMLSTSFNSLKEGQQKNENAKSNAEDSEKIIEDMMQDSMNLDDIPEPFQNAGPKKMMLTQRHRGGKGMADMAPVPQRGSDVMDIFDPHALAVGDRGSMHANFATGDDLDGQCRYKVAYQTMLDHDQLGYAIVVETCYVFTDVHPEQQIPLFCAMQQIIEKQREHQHRFENDKLESMLFLDDDDEEETEKEVDFAFSDHYDVLFEYMHNNLRLSYGEGRVTIPQNPYELIHRSPTSMPKFDFRLPLSYFDTRLLPLPLPKMTAEYGLSRLLLTIRHEALLMVLKVLLLERSVLVVGRTVEEVTCCTCTLLQLLHPFTWASAFMPLIRSDMLEFVQSPVPFLAGMVARNSRQLDNIKNDPCVKEAVRDGLSIIDLYRGRLTVTSATGIWEMLVDSHLPSTQLMSFQNRLEFLAKSEDSSLHSFKNFFKNGLGPREQLTLHAVKKFLGEYLANLANAAVDSSQQLEMFSRIEDDTDMFEFEHEDFAELRRKQVLARVSFFDEMSKTQLFLGYVEDNARVLHRRKDLMKGMEAMVIACWGVKYWKLFKLRKW